MHIGDDVSFGLSLGGVDGAVDAFILQCREKDSVIALTLLWLSSGDFAGCLVGVVEVADLADYITVEASDDVAFGFAFTGATSNVVDDGLVGSPSPDNGAVDRCV